MKTTIKKHLITLSALVSASMLSISAFASDATYTKLNDDNIVVSFNNREILFDVPPFIQNDRVMVPIRQIFEAASATLEWNDETSTATAVVAKDTLVITEGSSVMYKNGEPVYLDSPAVVINGRTFVPLRAISENLNFKVVWFDETKTVIIYAKSELANQYEMIADPSHRVVVPYIPLETEEENSSTGGHFENQIEGAGDVVDEETVQ